MGFSCKEGASPKTCFGSYHTVPVLLLVFHVFSLNTSSAKCKPNWKLKRFTFKVMFLVGDALFTVSLQLGDELASACRQVFHSNHKCNNMLATKAITKWSFRDILGVHISGCKPVSRPVSLRLYSLELSSP